VHDAKRQALFQDVLNRCPTTILNRIIRLHPKGSLDSDAGKHVQDKSYFPLRQGLPCAFVGRTEDSRQLDIDRQKKEQDVLHTQKPVTALRLLTASKNLSSPTIFRKK
jgi:hypothetical protein